MKKSKMKNDNQSCIIALLCLILYNQIDNQVFLWMFYAFVAIGLIGNLLNLFTWWSGRKIKKLESLLKEHPVRKLILDFIKQKKECRLNYKRIGEIIKGEHNTQTIKWHISRLEKEGVITVDYKLKLIKIK